MTTHSTQLGANLDVGTTEHTLYTVPAGKRTIVKSLAACNYASAATTLFVKGKVGSTDVWLLEIPLGGNTTDTRIWVQPVWIVMNAGDLLRVVANAASVSLVASGAELPA